MESPPAVTADRHLGDGIGEATALHLLEEAGALAYLSGPGGEVLWVSPSLRGLLAAEEADCATLDRLLPLLHVTPPILREAEDAHRQLLISSRDTWERESMMDSGGAEPRLVRWTVSRIPMGHGEGLAAVGRDETSDWKLERWVRLLSQIMARIDEAVVVTDLEGRVLHWGGGARRLLGGEPAERLGRDISRLLSPTSPQETTMSELLEAASRARDEELQVPRLELRRSDGGLCLCHLRGFPILDRAGAPVAVALLFGPAAPRTGDEGGDAPCSMAELFLKTSLVGVAVADGGGRILRWNGAAERLGGMGAAKAMGRLVFDEVLETEELDWEVVASHLEARGVFQRQLKVERPNGTSVTVDLEARPFDSGGSLLVLRDRGEEAGLGEELLLAKRASLEAIILRGLPGHIAAIGSSLEPAAGPLVRHLHTLLHMARRLEDGRSGDDLRELARGLDLHRLEREVGAAAYDLGDGLFKLQRLSRDMRSFVDAHRDAPQPVRLEGALEAACQLVAHRLHGEVEIRMDPTPLPAVRAISGPLIRGLCLLLLACADSCRRAAGHVGAISVTGSSEEGWVRLLVHEEGEGFGVDVRSRLLDLPYLATRPGLGPVILGLAREELRAAGGSLDLDGAPGAGSSATVCFPAAAASAALLGVMAEPRRDRDLPGPILLVEQDDLLRRALERGLGYRVQVLAHASVGQAIAALGSSDPVAVVVGLALPEGLGARLVRRLLEAAPHLAPNTVALLPPGVRSATMERLSRAGCLTLPRDMDITALWSVLARLLPDD